MPDKNQLHQKIEEIMEVYTIPTTLKMILEVIDNENSSIVELVHVVQTDQALTTKIIATANNAFYGMRRKISSLPSAALTLGFNMIKSIAVSVTIFSHSEKGHIEYQKALWRHSLKTALTARLIAEKTKLFKKEDAFLAGLIHDMGRTILYQVFGDKYVDVYNMGLDGLTAREEEAFGASHADVGAWFVDKYQFPSDCVLALKYHHEPEKSQSESESAQQLISIVYLADFLVSYPPDGGDAVRSPYHDDIISFLGLTAEDMEGLTEKAASLDNEVSFLN